MYRLTGSIKFSCGYTWLSSCFRSASSSTLLGKADLQFVLALGNRPKGERGLYLVTLWVYAVLAAYLIVCSVILSIEAFKDVLGIEGSIGDKLINMFKQTNGVLIAAVMSTIGELIRTDQGIKLMGRNLSTCFVTLRKLPDLR